MKRAGTTGPVLEVIVVVYENDPSEIRPRIELISKIHRCIGSLLNANLFMMGS